MAGYNGNGTGEPDNGGPHYTEPDWRTHANVGADGNGKGFVHERGELIVRTADLDALGRIGIPGAVNGPAVSASFTLLTGIEGDVVALARRLRTQGFRVQPNHVFFADPSGVDSSFLLNPVTFSSGGTYANPVTFSSLNPLANPVTFSGVGANPVTFSGAGPLAAALAAGCCADCLGTHQPAANPDRIPRQTLALAVDAPTLRVVDPNCGDGIKVVIIDTGLANVDYRPAAAGDIDVDSEADDTDGPDENGDLAVDIAAGHGTFIAGIIKRMAPKADIRVDRALSTFGAGDDAYIASLMEPMIADPAKRPDILNFSFSGYTEDDEAPMAITEQIQRITDLGTVVVASAGNSASCRKAWPAAQPEVVSVGALGPIGAAPFTNFGPWVRASAPGVDIISWFFESPEHGIPPLPDDREDKAFDGWAAWNGTSFSAPIVVGALIQANHAERAVVAGRPLTETVTTLIDDPTLCRMPALGTMVNAQP